jgi:quinol monooxygenase YgiN
MPSPGGIEGRDTDEPNRFRQLRPWESMESLRRLRAAPGFHERVAQLQKALDDFEPRTPKVVSKR